MSSPPTPSTPSSSSTSVTSTPSSSYASDSDTAEETPVTYQTFFPGQIVIAREFPEGSLRVSILAFVIKLTCFIKDYRRCTCVVLGIAGSPNPEITLYKITKEFIDDGHSYPITYVTFLCRF